MLVLLTVCVCVCVCVCVSPGPEPHLYDAHYSPGDGAVGCPEEYDEVGETKRLCSKTFCLAEMSLLTRMNILDVV